MPPAITADRLSKTFKVKVRDPGLKGALRALLKPRYRDVHAVRDVTFAIEPGEIVGFLGPNGAGKTTTLKMLAGLLYPTSGRAAVAGFAPWGGVPAFTRRVPLINRGRLLYDGALAALVARISRTKRIELVLADGVTREVLAGFGDVKEFRFPNAVLEVPREDAATTSARLLAALPVADLSIEDPPIEDVIRAAFAGGIELDEPCAVL